MSVSSSSRYSPSFADYTALDSNKVIKILETTQKHGLTVEEVVKRQREYGKNSLESKTRSWIYVLMSQFKSPFIYLLLCVALISFFLQNNTEGIVIIAIVLLNTGIGFFQEYRAEKTALLLRHYLSSKVRVVRNGIEIEVLTQELVPGDIVVLYPGDIIAADVRIIWEQSFTVDESALTGESIPVKKDDKHLEQPAQEIFKASNIGFAGTVVMTGKALGVVFATGKNSSLGGIASIATQTIRLSSFSQLIGRFSVFILYLMVISLVIIVIVHLMVKGSHINIIELLLFATALAVSAVPEVLPLVVTFALSQGALRLARNKTIVKRLSSIEDLGNIEILCTDKTGTLTENVLSVAHVYGRDERAAVWYAMLAGTLPGKHLSITKGFDNALYTALTEKEQAHMQSYHKVSEIPFDPSRLRTVALVRYKSMHEVIVRGAFEAVIDHCPQVSEQEKQEMRAWMLKEAQQGNRTLAVAIKKVEGGDQEYCLSDASVEQDLTCIGLVSFKDPLKKTALQAVSKAQSLGLGLKVLSGDSKEVCAAVAYQLGIINDYNAVMTGADFSTKTEEEKKLIIETYHVFARVTPEHKLEIIKLLKEHHDIGYLGDGINDVLALKEAHVGIAVQEAVDVAREAADIILLKRSLLIVVEGIEEGRRVFANTLKYLRITLSTSFGNFYSLGLAALFLDFLPMLPVQILLLNFLSDLPLITLATDSVDTKELKRPEKYDIKGLLILTSVLAFVSTFFDFIYFRKFLGESAYIFQTGWFVMSICAEMVFIFSMRTNRLFFRATPPSASLLFSIGIATFIALWLPYTALGMKLFSFVPLTVATSTWIAGILVVYFCVNECIKLMYYHLVNTNGKRGA